ncbi:hypothetical protein Tsubulata_013919 [Turnera subulata]|uniref:BSD domain-containing protein n=1 Tax=Turnera subulata TaxID=218843 RepID=A0A9Q0GFF0_9ROSI|nr:hypothetical protein Tsubulata_013919 [Turnera subulata]
MDWSSWFRRSLSRNGGINTKNTHNPDHPKQSNHLSNKQSTQQEEEFHGITEQLINHVKTFALDTFKNFPLQEDEGTTLSDQNSTTAAMTRGTIANVREDLSEWQERHATLVLSKVKELRQLRFTLCPRHMKERRFWRIYFLLVKSHVTEYELKAIQLAKLKQMAMEEVKPAVTGTYEVEMAETKQTASLSFTP